MYLAILNNSMIIEMYDDMIRISESFEGCQLSIYIAVTRNSVFQAAILEIINFLSLPKL